MFNISVNINATNNRGERTGMTISYKDFLALKNILSSIDTPVDTTVKKESTDIDLSKIEQGALIKELLKRPGVTYRIIKADDLVTIETRKTSVMYDGPANIIIIRNEEE